MVSEKGELKSFKSRTGAINYGVKHLVGEGKYYQIEGEGNDTYGYLDEERKEFVKVKVIVEKFKRETGEVNEKGVAIKETLYRVLRVKEVDGIPIGDKVKVDNFFTYAKVDFKEGTVKVSDVWDYKVEDLEVELEGKYEVEVENTERKFRNKIVGYRSGSTPKKVVATLVYLFIALYMLGSVTNFYGEEESKEDGIATTEETKQEEREEDKERKEKQDKDKDTEKDKEKDLKEKERNEIREKNKKEKEELERKEEQELKEQEQKEKEDKDRKEQEEIERKKQEEIERKEHEERERKEQEELERKKQEEESVTTITGLTSVTLSRVVDGDTVNVYNSKGEELKLRLLLIDTPETVHPNKPVEPFGPEASSRLSQLLNNAGSIQIEYDTGDKTDHYDRHLVYLYADGVSVHETLLKEGLARVGYIYEQQRYLSAYREAEQVARNQQIGIWSIPGYVNEGGEGFNSGERDSGSSESQTTQSTSSTSSGTESFKNCTELRKVYPDGVASDHPAYKPGMDRDKDNWACEN